MVDYVLKPLKVDLSFNHKLESIWETIFYPPPIAWVKGLTTNWMLYNTLSMKMYSYFMHDSSTPLEDTLKSIFKFSHMLIRVLVKGLSPN